MQICCDRCVLPVAPLMLLLECGHLFQFVSLAADLSLLPVDDLSVFRQLILPARTLVLQTL